MVSKNTSTKGAKSTPTKGKTSNPKSRQVTPGRGSAKGDTTDIIRCYLYQMRQMGIDSVDEKEILQKTGYARTDSTGYRKAIKKLIPELDHVKRSNGTLALTDTGVSYLEENGVAVEVKPMTMKDHQTQLKENILQHAKAPADKLNAVWDTLIDGNTHTRDELLKAAGYQRPDSTGYREIMKWFTKLELTEKDGAGIKFADKVYRYGARPNSY